MKLVTNEEEILENVYRLQIALSKGDTYTKQLIANGRCFYVVKTDMGLEFYPSRFIGYIGMTIEKHRQCKDLLDGTNTNPALINIIKPEPPIDLNLDIINASYIDFCINILNVNPSKHKKTFWIGGTIPEIEKVSLSKKEEIIHSHLEGEKQELLILRGKRVPQAVKQAKAVFKKDKGKLICEACGFDFEKTYGILGKDFIEAHHINPIGKRFDSEETKVKGFRMLCSNCHRMIHASKEMLTVEELKAILKKQKQSIK